MKKSLLVAVIILLTGVTFGQTLKKGMVVALSAYELTLKDNVTFDQFMSFNEQKYIPEIEKAMPGTKVLVLIGDRGENKFRYGEMVIFNDVATRNKYYPVEDDTATSPALKAIMPQMVALAQEGEKYLLNAKRIYTDWVTGRTSGITLKKGTVIALSSYDLFLKDDVTYNQYLDYCEQKYYPAFQAAMPGASFIMLRGDRGQNKFRTGEMWIFDNVDVRNKYFPSEDDTENSAALQTALDKIKSISDEGNKYVIASKRTYTDWIIR